MAVYRRRGAVNSTATMFNILDRRITCNRKDLQQLVAGSTAAVCAPRDAGSKAFQPKYATFIILRQKNRRTKDLFAMGKECRNVSHATVNCVGICQWENEFSP